MNVLSTADRVRIIACLVEGNSQRATCRMTGAAKKTMASATTEAASLLLSFGRFFGGVMGPAYSREARWHQQFQSSPLPFCHTVAEEAARRLAREIEECGKGCIGKPATKEQLSRLRTAMLSDLQRVASEVQMQRFESVWERMNLKEKVIWFVTRRILPSIGAYIDQVRPPAGENGHTTPLWAFQDPETVFIAEARLTLDGIITGVKTINVNLFVSQ